MSDQFNNQQTLRYDMASAFKAIGEFSGKEDESIDEWLKTIEVVSRMMLLEENEVVKTTLLALRGKART